MGPSENHFALRFQPWVLMLSTPQMTPGKTPCGQGPRGKVSRLGSRCWGLSSGWPAGLRKVKSCWNWTKWVAKSPWGCGVKPREGLQGALRAESPLGLIFSDQGPWERATWLSFHLLVCVLGPSTVEHGNRNSCWLQFSRLIRRKASLNPRQRNSLWERIDENPCS